MTVQYYQKVLTGGPVVFFRLLARWRGCVIKLIYMDLVVFALAYTTLSLTYRFGMNDTRKRSFERVVLYVRDFQSMIPVAFILGFYITLVFNRFWKHFNVVPWAIKISMSLVSHLHGSSDHVRLMRRTVVRYLNAALVLTVVRLHVAAKKRFPTNDTIVQAGMLNANEMEILEKIEPAHARPYIPVVWATSIITRAEREGLITNYHALVNMITQVNNFRQGCLNLFMMDQICVPLVYTQVVTLSVYTYFISCILGRQFVEDSSPLSPKGTQDMYVPMFTILEFFIYMGWLKVAETLVNPMGEDDEDFDVNEIIDYNWKVSLSLVDGMALEPPEIVKDAHWDTTLVELPHTEMSKRFAVKPYMGSVYDLHLSNPASSTFSLYSNTVPVHNQHETPEDGLDSSSPLSGIPQPGSTQRAQGGRLRRVSSAQTSAPIREAIEEVEEIEMDETSKQMGEDEVETGDNEETSLTTPKPPPPGPDVDEDGSERQTLIVPRSSPKK